MFVRIVNDKAEQYNKSYSKENPRSSKIVPDLLL